MEPTLSVIGDTSFNTDTHAHTCTHTPRRYVVGNFESHFPNAEDFYTSHKVATLLVTNILAIFSPNARLLVSVLVPALSVMPIVH